VPLRMSIEFSVDYKPILVVIAAAIQFGVEKEGLDSGIIFQRLRKMEVKDNVLEDLDSIYKQFVNREELNVIFNKWVENYKGS